MLRENNESYHGEDITRLLIGLAFEAFNSVGAGFAEKIYQNIYQELLSKNNINFEREKYCDLIVFDKKVGKYRVDFLIDERVVVELKCRNEIYPKDIAQVINYLKVNKLRLGLIFKFGKTGVEIKRLVS